MADLQAGTDLDGVTSGLPRGECRPAPGHTEPGDLRQIGDQVLGDAFAEIVLVRIAAEVLERQHGDRWLGPLGTCGPGADEPPIADCRSDRSSRWHAHRPLDVLQRLRPEILEGDAPVGDISPTARRRPRRSAPSLLSRPTRSEPNAIERVWPDRQGALPSRTGVWPTYDDILHACCAAWTRRCARKPASSNPATARSAWLPQVKIQEDWYQLAASPRSRSTPAGVQLGHDRDSALISRRRHGRQLPSVAPRPAATSREWPTRVGARRGGLTALDLRLGQRDADASSAALVVTDVRNAAATNCWQMGRGGTGAHACPGSLASRAMNRKSSWSGSKSRSCRIQAMRWGVAPAMARVRTSIARSGRPSSAKVHATL